MAPVKKPQPSSGGRKARKTVGPAKTKTKPNPRPTTTQVKTKPTHSTPRRKPKRPVYTDTQLNLAPVNSIIPANATAKSGRGSGKKKNKVYVDDTESMMTILAMVNAEKEGAIESKVLKARRMEEIREARRVEMEKRAEGKKGRFEEVKNGLKGKGRRDRERGGDDGKEQVKRSRKEDGEGKNEKVGERDGKKRKSVSFA